MKSSSDRLEKRGYLTPDRFAELQSEINCRNLSVSLHHSDPCIRTAAVRYIGVNRIDEYLAILCDLLKAETKLYTKLELGECISSFGKKTVRYLIPLLGQIGNNQHREVKNVDLHKKSYPLPRDIAARILIRIGPSALAELKNVLKDETTVRKLEAIDAIGHIACNYSDYSLEEDLILLYVENRDELIEWKLVRAFQGFPSDRVRHILEAVLSDPGKSRELHKEAERSLLRLNTFLRRMR
jgi:hypothetical protein